MGRHRRRDRPAGGRGGPGAVHGLLEEFDPDWLGVFAHSYRYHQLTDPDGFEAWLADYSAKSGEQSGIAPEEIRRMVLDDLDHPRERYTPAPALEKELLRRTAPFHRGDLLVGHRFLADVPMETLLTDMLGIADLPSLKVCQLDARAIDEDLHLMLAMRFGAVAPRYEEGRKARGIAVASVKPEAIRALADDYIAKHIFRRGLTLQCPVCRYAGWFRLVDIDDDVTCQRCRSRWVMTQPTWKKPADEPVWRYELDEVVFQAIDGNIAAPVLALDHLRQKSRDFLFAPEMDVFEVFKIADAVTAHEVIAATTQPAWNARAKTALTKEAARWPKVKLNLVEGLK